MKVKQIIWIIERVLNILKFSLYGPIAMYTFFEYKTRGLAGVEGIVGTLIWTVIAVAVLEAVHNLINAFFSP
ncbi:hypothetical protein [Brevibacillus daliensis]|uniref:hypothetical protein n=1 Tax=Brevibacillus daliensis TaxID=2892995 RepID=UPI001E2C0808|nr:hypothetical protein [Brevibacillus daliensis]